MIFHQSWRVSSFAESSCMTSNYDEEGWRNLQYAILASVGIPIAALTPDTFDTAGGNGHSLTNN